MLSLFVNIILLFQILNEIAQHKIKIYEFPECDDEEEKKRQKKLKVMIILFCVNFLQKNNRTSKSHD